MKKLVFLIAMLVVFLVSAKAPERKQLNNNSTKTAKKLCEERGHLFDSDSTQYIAIDVDKIKQKIVDYEDSTIMETSPSYKIKQVCLRCGKTITSKLGGSREVIWRKPFVTDTTTVAVDTINVIDSL